jgi:hypothetical protein
MLFAFVHGVCFVCSRFVSFNPHKVPSVRDKHNERQPVCEACVLNANHKAKSEGVDSFVIPDGAYEPFDARGL